MIEIIRYNSKAQAEALQNRLHNRLNGKRKSLRYNAKRYANTIPHPNGSNWGIILCQDKHPAVYDEIMSELTGGEKNKIENYSDEWKSEIENG